MKSGHCYAWRLLVGMMLGGFTTIAAAQSPAYYSRTRTSSETRAAGTAGRGTTVKSSTAPRARGTTLTSATADSLRPYSSQSVTRVGMNDDDGPRYSTRNVSSEPEPIERAATPSRNYYPGLRSSMYPNAAKVPPSSRHHICVPSCGGVLRAAGASHAR